ncbi:PEPxxWA-CTERM sorting domain-containing protein [Sphingomonas bacterium]|uniref:PEPxxWA-CTERM sorting domain-containing protein n=1 Tax=Sphingomonas bacterium TaxID=1895847 RepID=UPI001576A4FB|nr:PEPxxWA-CTERM sorting domain-containing protein [Sphingomonas bacterium]
MRKSFIGIAGALALGLTVAPASAAIITTATQTINFGGPTDFTQIQTFALFDSNLGTLKSINVYDSYGITSTVNITNNAGSSSTGYARTDSTFDLLAADANQNAVFISLLPQLEALGQKVNYTLGAGGSTSGNSNSTTQVNDFVSDTTAADLAYFAVSGGGNSSVTGKTFTSTVQSNTGGNTSSSQVTTGTGSFKIFYTYDDSTAVVAVPEPASWGMMILGFGMMGALARRRSMVLANG